MARKNNKSEPIIKTTNFSQEKKKAPGFVAPFPHKKKSHCCATPPLLLAHLLMFCPVRKKIIVNGRVARGLIPYLSRYAFRNRFRKFVVLKAPIDAFGTRVADAPSRFFRGQRKKRIKTQKQIGLAAEDPKQESGRYFQSVLLSRGYKILARQPVVYFRGRNKTTATMVDIVAEDPAGLIVLIEQKTGFMRTKELRVPECFRGDIKIYDTTWNRHKLQALATLFLWNHCKPKNLRAHRVELWYYNSSGVYVKQCENVSIPWARIMYGDRK